MECLCTIEQLSCSGGDWMAYLLIHNDELETAESRENRDDVGPDPGLARGIGHGEGHWKTPRPAEDVSHPRAGCRLETRPVTETPGVVGDVGGRVAQGRIGQTTSCIKGDILPGKKRRSRDRNRLVEGDDTSISKHASRGDERNEPGDRFR